MYFNVCRYVTCNNNGWPDAASAYKWQTCNNPANRHPGCPTGCQSFELLKNGQGVLLQSAWGVLPAGCAAPSTPTGNIVCFVTVTFNPGDTVQASWYEQRMQTSISDNAGELVVDIWGVPVSVPAVDVLGSPFGTCKSHDPNCFQRMPSWLPEARTSLLAKDANGNVFTWQFSPNIPAAHAAWLSLTAGVPAPYNQAAQSGTASPWNPTVIGGSFHGVGQTKWMYRVQNGVGSFSLTKDYTNCYATLQV